MRELGDFEGAYAIGPRGERLAALRAAASELRGRLEAEGVVESVRAIDVGTETVAVRHAFGGAVRPVPIPAVKLIRRTVLVRFRDFEGNARVLCWRPVLGELTATLGRDGLTRDDVHYVAFGDLRGQDVRALAGTVQPVAGEREPRLSAFPRARLVCQRREAAIFDSPHPMESSWYVPGGMDHVVVERLEMVDGDVELGVGVALLWTPGLTPGNQSLVVNTRRGIWVVSGNGVAADNWHPNLSKIPGVRREAELLGCEVLATSRDQYDSMVKEKVIADPNREDPRWKNVLPSSELPALRRQWPVTPSYTYGGLDH